MIGVLRNQPPPLYQLHLRLLADDPTVFGGMLIEPFTSFIVPTLYCAFMEKKCGPAFLMKFGLLPKCWKITWLSEGP